MIRTITMLVMASLSCMTLFAQKPENYDVETLFKNTGEIYFSIQVDEKADVSLISKYVSIDNCMANEILAYANREQYEKFRELNYSIRLLPHPGTLIKNPVMREQVDLKDLNDWDYYPTYEGYIDIMNQFGADYPDLCQVFSIGQTVEGRALMFVRISDNVGVEEGEAKVMYTSSMHGDELTGYIMTLRLIEYLLENYGTDDRITEMVNSLDIFINPLANPDGTYAGGNNTVYGATRYNANNVDLNRNYPDIEEGPHPDGNQWQTETVHFMQLAEDYRFVLSANFHGGAEVFNYPWDTWYQRHADDDWWYDVAGRSFADTIHEYTPPESDYFTFMLNGVTNGYDWYSISGGRQDFMNGFYQCREVTIEISDIKTPAANDLPDYWDWLHRSMLNYLEQAYYGIQGVVTDSETGDPVKAKITIENHDDEWSHVFAYESTGNYYRPIKEGSYTVTVSAPCYDPQTFYNISVTDFETTILDVELVSSGFAVEFEASNTIVQVGESIDFMDLSCGNPTGWEWTFEGGEPGTANVENPEGITYNEAGTFDVSLSISDGTNTATILKEDYISVSLEYNMEDATITTCLGLFYDSGGPDGSYQNDEDYVMIFLPGEPGAKIICNFLEFYIEENSSCEWDWLNIYDGENTSAPLIGTYCGTNSPGELIASSESGALTFEFHSDYSVTQSGWMAEISCDGTSAMDGWSKEDINIFPNPVKGKMKITSPVPLTKLEIYQLDGAQVNMMSLPAVKEAEMDVSNLPAGVYFIKVTTVRGIRNEKLIVR